MVRALTCLPFKMSTLAPIKMDYLTAKVTFTNGLLEQYTKETSSKEEKKEEDNGRS